MTKKYPLFIIGAAALLTLTPFGVVKAQALKAQSQNVANSSQFNNAHAAAMQLQSGKASAASQLQSGKASAASQLKPSKITPAQLKARMAESKAKHPLLHQRLLPTKVKHDSIVRLNRNIEAGIKMKQTANNSNFILRANNNETKTLWGNVLFDETWGDQVQYGMYTFKNQAPVKTNKEFADDFCRATGAGAWIDNELYFVMYQNFWGVDMVYLYKYDTDTWTQQVEQRLTDFSLVASETAIADDGTVYGCFLDADGVYNELGVADYANVTRSTIGRLKHSYVAMGITKDNILYGIAEDGNLYKIDTKTAEETFVGSTGKQLTKADGSFFYQSGEIDQSTNTFYWDCVDANQKSTLYTVDLSTGQLTEIGDFANNEIVALLTIPKVGAALAAPAAATNLGFDFKEGSLTGNVTFKAPTKTFGGTKLKDDKLTYTILSDKEEIAKGETTPGAEVSQEVTLKNGYNNITVLVSNDAGTSPRLASRYYAGFDKPVSTGNVKTTLDEQTGKVSVTWQAPTEGENGGYVGGVTYDIKRYPGGELVKEGYQGTSFEDVLPQGEKQTYAYGITPNNHGVKGAEQVSNYVAYGSAITPPYSNGFDDEGEMAYFTVLDDNGDGVTWQFDEPRMANDFDGSAKIVRGEDKHEFDDWLVSPALKVKAGHQYKLSFRIKGWSKYYDETMEIKYGAAPDDLTETLVPSFTISSSDYDTRSVILEPKEDGDIYIGYHATSGKYDAMGLYIDDFYLTAGVDLQAPDKVTDLQAVADPAGALKTDISFVAPTKQVDGGELKNITKFQLRRTGKVVAEIPAAAPGSTVHFTDDTATNGINIYSVAACNDKGASFFCDPVAIYVGEDAPTAPVKSNTETGDNSVRLNWQAPERGTHTGYVNPKTLTYTVAESDGNDYYPTYTAVGKTVGDTHFDYAIKTNEGSVQTVKTLFVNAANQLGESSYTPLPSFILGKPYELPFSASVKNYMFYGILWSAWGTGKSDFELSTESVDNDGGSFYLMPVSGDDISYLGSGKINLGGALAPKLMLHYKASEASNAKITVEVETPDGKSHVAGTIDCSKTQEGQWNAAGIDLSQWANEPFITFDFAVQGDSYSEIYLDRLFVRDTQTDDLNPEIEAAETVKKGAATPVTVRVNNFGENDAKKFTVKLYANGKLVESQKNKTALKAYDFADFTFDYQTNVLDPAESVELKAVVDYAYDLNEDDNEVSTNVKYTTSNKPKPDQLTADATDEGVTLTWTPVVSSAQNVDESFEKYTSWSQDNFGDFTSEAVNSGTTGGIFENYKFPNQGSNYGFMLFDPLNGWLTDEQLESVPDFKAHSGDKYLASLYRVDEEGYAVNQNNWLISPELSGDKQTVSFWVKNVNDGDNKYPETFDVLYSTTDQAHESFTKLGETHTVADGEWQRVEVEVPAGTKYFAINQNTEGDKSFVFMVDDINYTYGAGEVTGYNVYRDGKLLGTVEAGKSSFTDTEIKHSDSNTYQYGVTAVYADGESEATLCDPVVPTGISTIVNGAAKTFDVYTPEGICVAKGVRNLNLLKKGVYVVNGQKVIIK